MKTFGTKVDVITGLWSVQYWGLVKIFTASRPKEITEIDWVGENFRKVEKKYWDEFSSKISQVSWLLTRNLQDSALIAPAAVACQEAAAFCLEGFMPTTPVVLWPFSCYSVSPCWLECVVPRVETSCIYLYIQVQGSLAQLAFRMFCF